jgi:hypothetical protein
VVIVICPIRKKNISCLLVWAVAFTFSVLSASAQNLAPSPVQTGRDAQAAQPKVSPKQASKAPITVLEETLLRVWTIDPLNSKRLKHGTPLVFMVSEDVDVGDALAVPRGATVHGLVTESKKAGRLTGSPDLTLELVSLDLGGRSYPLYTHPFKVTGMSKTEPTEKKVVRGAFVGGIVGSAVSGVSTTKGIVTSDGSSRVAGMATGAGVGAGVGTVLAAASPGPTIWIPSESQLDFFLAAPITVVPVSAKEAARLAEGLHSGGPTLYVRGDIP